jgi:hypothetical protein
MISANGMLSIHRCSFGRWTVASISVG